MQTPFSLLYPEAAKLTKLKNRATGLKRLGMSPAGLVPRRPTLPERLLSEMIAYHIIIALLEGCGRFSPFLLITESMRKCNLV
ncbi:hypothetical protein TNCT_266631 [Trichonephila clavata]|uniref:Uncharacterized protein n=2 Tax=Trichonephila TaxID=2585208 RepID=A0A8X6FH72_TRICU|nr:hypothetical protein TNCT_266631 [Trichonephila clavata]GFS34919.1 hypothetical protein TNIN_388781 [Trichonephila inaurata madagascariensis]